MKDDIKDIKAKDNQWFEVITKKNERTNFSCCDCGLSHRLRAKIKGKKILFSLVRDNPMTERNRRERKYIKR